MDIYGYRNRSIIYILLISIVLSLKTTPAFSVSVRIDYDLIRENIQRCAVLAEKYQKENDLEKLTFILIRLKQNVEVYNGEKYSFVDFFDDIYFSLIEEKGKLINKEKYENLITYFEIEEKRLKCRDYFGNFCLKRNISLDENILEKFLAKNAPKKDLDVPLQLTVGVAAALCGFFLLMIPEPLFKPVATALIIYGLSKAADVITNTEEEKKEVKKIKKILQFEEL